MNNTQILKDIIEKKNNSLELQELDFYYSIDENDRTIELTLSTKDNYYQHKILLCKNNEFHMDESVIESIPKKQLIAFKDFIKKDTTND